MVSFSPLDVAIIIGFFLLMLATGFIFGNRDDSSEGYLLSGRSVGLFLFVITNVATWYGGILGVGEFTYRYGLLSWFTQGFPYYLFAILFAFLFAKKIRGASLYTIPDKLSMTYGKDVGLAAGVIIFLLVSPAPYLLMIGNLIALIFDISLFWSLVIGLGLSAAYLFYGGLKADIFTDALAFFVMFIGFGVIVFVAITTLGGIDFLTRSLPETHLQLTGGESPTYVIVWFLIALWTFTDPGFHQRCYAAKTPDIAFKGILLSVILWACFDFLTTSTGLYARALLPGLDNPVLAFPLFAEEILGSGFKGIFYAALFATILSTLNSFLFLSATTFGRDFVYKLAPVKDENKLKVYTRWGLLVTSVISVLLAYSFDSVIEIWYLIGSICIPGIIVLIISSYYDKYKVSNTFALIEIMGAIVLSLVWYYIRPTFSGSSFAAYIEPMIVGLVGAILIHLTGLAVKTKRAE